jgi:3-oxo-5-alpha-steroid 4-dehydrogenase 1
VIPHSIYDAVLLAIFASGAITFVVLFVVTAPYGRHAREGWGPAIPTRIAWVAMESPSVIFFAWCYLRGPHPTAPAAVALFCAWQAHYVHRAFVYPLTMRVGARATTPASVAAMGFTFNAANSYVNGTWLATSPGYGAGWLGDPRFVLGLAVFVAGYALNRRSDAILRNLRKPGETGYAIPRGGAFRWVSCPNYLGELVEWTGWAIATFSLAGASFAFFTATNLVPRAIANHRWYKEKFPDYPRERRAIIPLVL